MSRHLIYRLLFVALLGTAGALAAGCASATAPRTAATSQEPAAFEGTGPLIGG